MGGLPHSNTSRLHESADSSRKSRNVHPERHRLRHQCHSTVFASYSACQWPTKSPYPRERQIARHFGVTGVLELTYAIVGQPLAKRFLSNYLLEYIACCTEESKPVTFAFTGVRRHGKSGLARKLAGLLNCEYHYVDCEDLSTQSQMFGPIPNFRGSGKAGSLNNFLFQNEGKRCLIYLEYFEIASEEVYHAVGALLDDGVHIDFETRKETKPSMKTIWVLATDLSSEILSKFACEHDMPEDGFMEKAPYEGLRTTLQKDVSERITPWLTSRLTEVVPFFTFSGQEAAVVAHSYFLRFIQE